MWANTFLYEDENGICLMQEGNKIISPFYKEISFTSLDCNYVVWFIYEKNKDNLDIIKSCDILDKETWKIVDTFDLFSFIHQGVWEDYWQFYDYSKKEYWWFDLMTGKKIILQEKGAAPRTLSDEDGIFHIWKDIEWWCDKNWKTIAKWNYSCQHFVDDQAIFIDYSKPKNKMYGLMWIDWKIIIENQEYISEEYELKDWKIINYYPFSREKD